jgi:hypothetical protein
VEGDVYGFGVEDIEITEVAEKAEITKVAEKAKITEVAKKAKITEVAEKAKITEVAEMAKMTKGVRGIRTTTRHVVRPVAKMAEASIKTTRHVM